MLETNNEINIENKNPLYSTEPKNKIKLNLGLKSDKDNNDFKKIEINKINEETAMSEHDDEEGNQINENICLNIKKTKIFNIIEEENYQNNDNVDNNNNETIANIFRSSKINRESLQPIIIENDDNIDNSKENSETNKVLLKRFMIVLEIILGTLLTSGSIFLIIIIFKEKILEQKILGIIIEPLIILISLLGMNPCKNEDYKKILLALYIWEGLFLYPFSFYIKIAITENYYYFFDIIIKVRILLLSIQFIIFIISLAFKINI